MRLHDPGFGAELEADRHYDRSPVSELPLLYQFLMFTSRTFTHSREAENCWRHIFPQLGFAHDFVMQAIFSIAAMHLAYTCPTSRKEYLHTAMRCNAISVRGICDNISRLNSQIADAVFAAASLNNAYVFCTFGRLNHPHGSDTSITLRARRTLGTDWIPMVRGVGAVLAPIYGQVRNGRLGPMVELPAWDIINLDIAHGSGDDRLCNLALAWVGDRDAELYDTELESLRKCRIYIQSFMDVNEHQATKTSGNGPLSGPSIWLHFCSNVFLRNLHQRKPEALLLFAYFGTLIHILDDYWFMEGWGRDIVEVTSDLLGDAWDEWMLWPRRFVETSAKRIY